jgi:hypothetical protein
VTKRPSPVSRHCQSIRSSTRFKRLPVWVSKADIVAYLKLSPTDAQALFDGADRRCLIDGVEKISKYQLAIEKILNDPTHPQYAAFQQEFAKYTRGAR